MKIIQTSTGNSLVGIITSVGISMIVLLGAVEFLSFSQKGRNQFAASAEFQQLKTTGLLALINAKTCTDIFKDKDIFPPWQSFIVPADSAQDAVPTFRTISMNGIQVVPTQSLFDLKDIELRVQQLKQGPIVIDQKRIVFAEVSLQGSRKKDGLGMDQFKDRIPVQLIIDEAMMTASTPAKIVSCYSLNTACTPSGFPPLSATPPACEGGIGANPPTVTITSIPSANRPLSPPPGNLPMVVDSFDCVLQTSARMNVYVQNQGDATPRLVSSGILPTSTTIINEAGFNYLLLETELKTPQNRVVTEVECFNGAYKACDHAIILK